MIKQNYSAGAGPETHIEKAVSVLSESNGAALTRTLLSPRAHVPAWPPTQAWLLDPPFPNQGPLLLAPSISPGVMGAGWEEQVEAHIPPLPLATLVT